MLKGIISIFLFMVIAGVFYAGMNERDISFINPVYQNAGLSLNSFNPLNDLSFTSSLEDENTGFLVAAVVTTNKASLPQKQPAKNPAPAKKPAAPAKKQPEAQSGWHPSVLNICGYALIVVGVGSFGAGYYFDTMASKDLSTAQKKYDDYKNATSDTDTKWNDYQNQLNIAKQDVQYRNIFYIAGGVTLGAGIIMAFIPNYAKKTAGIYVTPNSINVALRF